MVVLFALLAVTAFWWPDTAARPLARREAAASPGSAGEPATPATVRPKAQVAQEPADERSNAPAQAPPATGTIFGTVTRFPQEPVVGAVLLVLGRSRETLATASTDEQGAFSIAVWPDWPERVSLSVEAAHHLPHTEARVRAGEPVHVRLLEAYELFGRVATPDGTPLAGVVVQHGPETTRTDANGDYELVTGGVRGRTNLLARRDGYADEFVSVRLHEPGRARVDVTLRPLARLAVQVVDADTRAPIGDAEVRLGWGDRPETVRSDADGRFELAHAPGDDLRVVLRAAGYCAVAWRCTVEEIDRPFVVPMPREGTIQGRVVDASGRALGDASVTVDPVEPAPRSAGPLSGLCGELALPGALDLEESCPGGRTDVAGRFAIPVLPGARAYRVQARLEGFVLATSGPVSVPHAQARPFVELVLTEAATVFGTVRRNDEPWRGSVCWQSADRFGIADVDDQGAYELPNVAPGATEIALLEGGAKVKTARLTTEPGGRHRQDFVWHEPRAPIRGRVTEASGAPVAGQTVRAWSNGRWTTAETDADGSYELDVAPPGPFRVTVRRDSITEHRDGVAFGASGVDFVLPEVGSLRLRLLDDATGRPIPGGSRSLSAIAWRRPDETAFRATRDALDGTGLVALELPLGRVDVSLSLTDAGYAPQVLRGLLVTRGAAAPPQVVRLTRGVAVELTVEHPEDLAAALGRPLVFVLDRARLGDVRGPFAEPGGESNHRVNGVDMWLAQPGLVAQMPDFGADGRAVLRGQPPGRYRVVVFPDDLAFTPAEFDVGPDGASVALSWRRR